MTAQPQDARELVKARGPYSAGFVTDIATDTVAPGLSEDTIRMISARKNEPQWLLDWRLKAYARWLKMPEPTWAHVHYPKIDYQAISYYSTPKGLKDRPKSLDEVDPKLLETYKKLGIPLREQEMLAGVAVDVVFDSVCVATTFKEKLKEAGVIFCPISEAVHEHPELVKKYLGSVVPQGDNFYAALNSAVFTDGSFVYIPKGVRCPMELSHLLSHQRTQYRPVRTHADHCRGRLARELSGRLHRTAARREPAARGRRRTGGAGRRPDQVLDRAKLVPGRRERQGRHLQLRHQARRLPRARAARSVWTQVETGSAITWKYPSCILRGDDSVGEFYSVALTHHRQQADTGTKMIHIGKRTKSTIVSKGISAGHGQQTYRGLVRVLPSAENARNHTQCDSLLIGDQCGAHTFPYTEVRNSSAHLEHEATTSQDRRRPAVLRTLARHR